MTFIRSDETNILMDAPNTGRDPTWPEFFSRAVPHDDMIRLVDAGVSTVLQLVPWSMIEMVHGKRNWEMPDEMVERACDAGLKSMLMTCQTIPDCLPDDWYVRTRDGTPIKRHDPREPRQTWSCLSPWNNEAMNYQIDYIRECCDRYNSDDVMCINSLSQDGESLLPPGLDCIYDPAAMRSWRDWCGNDLLYPHPKTAMTQAWMREALMREVIDQQKVYATHPSGEVFVQLHPVYTAWPASGVGDIMCYVDAVMQQVIPSRLHYIIFQAWTDAFQSSGMPEFVAKLVSRGVSVWTGSEWPDGLVANTPRAIAQGIRGLITSPLHPFLKRERIEPWVYDAFAASRKMFLESR